VSALDVTDAKSLGLEGAARERFDEVAPHFAHWEVLKDCIDQFIHMMLNYRLSGHPGGSLSKVYGLLATLLSGAMRWDIRHPEKRFADRFLLVAGHTTPLLYSTLAVLNETLRTMLRETGDERFRVPGGEERTLTFEDLLTFRRRGGLAGHAEMEGKTLFVKFNTGPSGHGSPPAAGEALALKRAGAEEVKVWAFEGEGGLTTGAAHETKNSAWGLGLSNLYYVVDWNDFGIDPRPASSVVHGTPRDWFEPYGWRVSQAEDGANWADVTAALFRLTEGENPDGVPNMMYMRTRKGRSYLKYDAPSHGAPHSPMNCELFWKTKEPFMERYGVEFVGYGKPAPEDPQERHDQALENMKRVAAVLNRDEKLVQTVAERLVELGDSVPRTLPRFRFDTARNPLDDDRLYDFRGYPEEMWAKPGAKVPNRKALASWGAWVNTWCRKEYGRPLFLAMAADLADSTNISGFAKDFGDEKGWGWFDRRENPEGVLLPQEITEFANAGISAGISIVNFSERPYEEFNGFLSSCSTYGSFVYLKYGPMRLFSQVAQDSQIKVGKVLWVAGHSGPETAEDARTHFGIFSPGVTQLFPEGHVVDVHPWEYNEVPVVIAAALKQPAAIVALHLTRPPIEIPDREALGIPSHFEAARGAYVMRDYRNDQDRMGTVIVQGTSTTNNVVKILPELDSAGLNVKLVAAISPYLFRVQDQAYRDEVLSPGDWMDSTCISNRSRRTMHDWLSSRVAEEYALTSDWDDRWRTGGSVEEVVDEAHLSPEWLLQGIERFAKDRSERLARLEGMLEKARSG
jgi:transketolase